MKVLVTGGAGFIGSHYVRTLLAGGYPGIRRWPASPCSTSSATRATWTTCYPVADHPGFTFVEGDICDAGLLAGVLPGPRLRGELRGRDRTWTDRSVGAAFVAANVTGVQVLAQACLDAGVRRLVHVSTDEVYGSVRPGSATEDAPLMPNSPYAASKAGGDLIALAYARTHGLDVRVTRGANTYGPYQYPGEGDPALRHQPARRPGRAAVRRRHSTSAAGCTSMTTAAASSSPCATASQAASTTSAGTSS